MKAPSPACKIGAMKNIGKRIQMARERKGLNQSELARLMQLRPQSVQQWEHKDIKPRTQRLEKLAEILEVSQAWLLGEIDEMESNVRPAPAIVNRIPLISWVQAGQWNEAIDMHEPGYADEWIATTDKVGPHAFSLIVEGESMEPEFPAGLILIVDPDIDAMPGDYVIAKIDDHATFKKLVSDAGQLYLKPLNPRFPTMKMVDGMSIAGVVVSATRRFRR